jgi:hypothetical protein
MRRTAPVIALLAWVLWAQGRGLIEINDQVMVESSPDGIWKYLDAFDGKIACFDRRKVLLAEQQAALAALTPTADLSKLAYRELKCYPETIDPREPNRNPYLE